MKKSIFVLFCLCVSLVVAEPPPSPISKVVVDGVVYPVYAYPKDVKAVSRTPPNYPYRAVQEGRGGEILVGAVVGQKGQVIATFIAKSTGAIDLQRAVRVAVKKWKFPTLKVDDKPIEYVLFIPLTMCPK